MTPLVATTTSLRVKDARRVVFFTGAGMSAAAGIPTFRGKGGIWKEYDYGSYACQQAFNRDPEKVWEFHNYRRGLVEPCQPTQGHRLIARCEAAQPSTVVVTQNIDGLHQVAGNAKVRELHGGLWRVRCDVCGAKHTGRESPFVELRCPRHEDLPEWKRPYWRPDIVWFGDALNRSVIEASVEAISRCDMLISIGTSAVVYPAAELPLIAKRNKALLVEINPEETPMSNAFDVCLRGTADAMLEMLCEGLE